MQLFFQLFNTLIFCNRIKISVLYFLFVFLPLISINFEIGKIGDYFFSDINQLRKALELFRIVYGIYDSVSQLHFLLIQVKLPRLEGSVHFLRTIVFAKNESLAVFVAFQEDFQTVQHILKVQISQEGDTVVFLIQGNFGSFFHNSLISQTRSQHQKGV